MVGTEAVRLSFTNVNMQTTCGALLSELEEIWTDIGKDEDEKDKMLMELEMECLQVYRRKVEEACNTRAFLRQSLVANEAEMAALIGTLGEHNLPLQTDKRPGSLKRQLAFITEIVEDLRLKKDERVKKIAEIRSEIEKIIGEINGHNLQTKLGKEDDEDLSTRKLLDYQAQLRTLQKEKDENRYSAGRGAHLNLKHAEKARVTAIKIPAIVDNLISKTIAWEDERNMHFFYDGVRLISLLEEYKLARHQKEEEKKRFRDQKKLQHLLLTEKEALYGSKSSPKKSNSLRKPNGCHAYGNANGFMTPAPRRVSVGSATPELLTPRSYSGRQNGYFKEMRRLSTAPLNFVSIPKEDRISSFTSISCLEPGSPPRG